VTLLASPQSAPTIFLQQNTKKNYFNYLNSVKKLLKILKAELLKTAVGGWIGEARVMWKRSGKISLVASKRLDIR